MDKLNERIEMMRKIEQLLNKTTEKGATEAEAESAILMAQKLMAKYHIQEKELNLGQEPVNEVFRKSTGYKAMAQWSIQILQLIAKNFRCKSYLSNKEAAFIGEEADLEIAIKLYKMVSDIAERGTKKIRRQYRKEGNSTGGVADSYLRGFISGLEAALKAQFQQETEDNAGFALVLVTPQAVVENYQKLITPSTKTVHGRELKGNSDNSAFSTGYTDGRASINPALK